MSGRAFIPNNIDIMVGRVLCNCRQMQGLSQKDVADKVGVSFQQIQKYESGGNRISASRLYAIAEVLQIPLHAFFKEVETSSTVYDKKTHEIIRHLMRIPDKEKDLVVNMVRHLVH